MVDTLGTVNKLSWVSKPTPILSVGVSAVTQYLESITLPDIDGTIILARLKMTMCSVSSADDDNHIDGTQHIQIKESVSGSYINAIEIPDNSLWTYYELNSTYDTPNGPGGVIYGAIDITSEVDSFNKTYLVQWLNSKANADSLYIHELQLELEVWYTLDSGVEAKIDDIIADTDELQTDWADGGRLDMILDDTQEKSNDAFDLLDTGGAIEVAIADILTDTNELQTDWTDGGRLDLILDAIASQTVPADIADAVWDALRSAYIASGSMGEAVSYLFDDLEDNIRGADNDSLTDLSDQLDSLESDISTILGKLPTNYLMGSSDQDDWNDAIEAIFDKLPTDYIMGSSILTSLDDEIIAIYGKLPTNYIAGASGIGNVIESELAEVISYIASATGNVTVSSGTNLSFQSDLVDADDFWNDLQVLMISGSNAGQVRRISDFANTNGVVTVDVGFENNPALNDTFVIIGRWTPAGSSLTPAGIASAVWDELLAGHVTSDSAAEWVKNMSGVVDAIKIVVDAIEVDTQDIQSRLPATLIGGLMRAHTQAKDSTLALSAQEKLDVNAEVDQALLDYDGVTQDDLDIAESNIIANDDANTVSIIAEVDANETAIGLVQVDVTTLLNRLGIPATTIYQTILDAITEIDANETLILTLTGDLATHDLAIKTLIGIPIVDLITDVNNRFDIVDSNILANYNAIIQIQNNTTTVFIVPEKLVRPDTGTKPYSMIVLNRNTIGEMEDFDALPSIRGDYVSGGVLFAPTAMTHDGLGQYSFEYDLASDDVLGAVNVMVSAVEGGNLIVLIRTSEVSDFDDELAEIKADTEAIYIKVDAGVPSPTIPDQIEQTEIDILDAIGASEISIISEIDENQDLIQTIISTPYLHLVSPSLVAFENGYTKIDNNGNDLLVGATSISLIDGSVDYFPDSGFVIVDDGLSREELEYTSKTATSLVLATPTTIQHIDGTPVYAKVDATVRLYIEANDFNVYHELDDLPVINILSEFGIEESGQMVWDALTRSYYFTKSYIATEYLAGKRNIIISTQASEGMVAKHAFATFELLDRPSSKQQLDQVISGGIMPDTFVFDHDGWKDESNILHEWTDEMEGPLHDDTGKPATGILVRAFLKGDDDQWLLVNNPHYHDYSNIFGHYRGSLEAGTYLFTFYKDNHKWKEVERTIGL